MFLSNKNNPVVIIENGKVAFSTCIMLSNCQC